MRLFHSGDQAKSCRLLKFCACSPQCYRHYRKPDVCRVPKDLLSAQYRALGKITICRVAELCRVTATWHSAKPHFAECLNQDTRRTHLCRVPRGQHSATSVTCATQARTRPLQRGRRYFLPSASQCALGKDNHVRRTRPLPRCHPVATNVTLYEDRYRYDLPSARLGTLGKTFCAECQLSGTRQSSVNAECNRSGTRH